MNQAIISLSERGQITIPQEMREQIQVKHFICTVENGNVVLKPLQTREEFVFELEEAEKDWEKRGGKTLQDIKKKFSL